MGQLEIIKENLLKKEDNLSKYACKSSDAFRLNKVEEDIRPAFFHDIDKVIHSRPYARYMNKTQVYSFYKNDHISTRMLHVQLVSKVARTIGRCLNLNEDLIEAIGLSHDIGHTPLGHVGEKILNEISLRELNQPFMHNLQSVREFMYLSEDGKGSNLTVQVLDGIMCHNGEKLERIYEPVKKTKEEFLKDYNESIKSHEYASLVKPMTLEGCVVRISDVIAYIGRDIEDAITLGKLDRKTLPKDIVEVLGNNNSEIINNIVLDIVQNSYEQGKIILSEKVYNAMNKLMTFNYKNIYDFANSSQDIERYKENINKLYNKLLEDLDNNKKNSTIYKLFLSEMSEEYRKNNCNKQVVIDFIAGMTDDYFMAQLDSISVN